MYTFHCLFVSQLISELLTINLHQRTPLHAAAKGGYIDTVKCLVQKGANLRARDVNGVSMTTILT